MHDFENEIKAARKLQEILDKEEGIQHNVTAIGQVSEVLQKNLYALPKRLLDGIYEKLEILKSAGLDVERQREIYAQYTEQLKIVLQNIEKTDEQVTSMAGIEQVVQVLRDFLYMLAYIDYLKGEVDSMCRNYITMMGKLSP